jgi:hypothetical protein
VVQALIDKGAGADEATLILAARNGHHETVKILLADKRIDLTSASKDS